MTTLSTAAVLIDIPNPTTVYKMARLKIKSPLPPMMNEKPKNCADDRGDTEDSEIKSDKNCNIMTHTENQQHGKNATSK